MHYFFTLFHFGYFDFAHRFGPVSTFTVILRGNLKKGYIDEKFDLSVEIDRAQIARVTIKNVYIGNDYHERCEINKLRFYYDLNDIEE